MKIALIHTVKPLVSTFEEGFLAFLPKYMEVHGKPKIADTMDSLQVTNLFDDYLVKYLWEHERDDFHLERLKKILVLAEASEADCIMVTCSSLSLDVRALREAGVCKIPIYTIDESMLSSALTQSEEIGVGRVTILATAESTLEPTKSHLKQLGDVTRSFPTLDMQVVSKAYEALKSGNMDLHDNLVYDHIMQLHNPGVVVLAQASMAHIRVMVGETKKFPILESISFAYQRLAQHIIDYNKER